MTIHQVKEAIFRTECENIILDGLCCSEPIMEKKGDTIIDNYFVYAMDREKKSYSGPITSFGICSEQCRVEYVNKNLTGMTGHREEETYRAKNWQEYDVDAYNEYVTLFSVVREFLLKKGCTIEEKNTLGKYVASMKKIVDDALWPIYIELFPSFFDWCNSELS